MKIYKIGLIKRLFVWTVLPITAIICFFVGILFHEELGISKENSQILSEFISAFQENEVEMRKNLEDVEETNDFDGDGLDNSAEISMKTSVYLKDSDRDGLSDKFEYDYITNALENENIGDFEKFLFSHFKGYASFYSKNYVKPKNISSGMLYDKGWIEDFADSTGLKISEDYHDSFDKDTRFKPYSGKVFEGTALIGKPFICEEYSGYVEIVIPKKLLKSSDKYDEIYLYQYNMDADVYSYSDRFSLEDYDEDEDFKVGINIDGSDFLVNCFCYNAFDENGNSVAPYNYESFKFSSFMNTHSPEANYVVLDSTDGGRFLLFSESFASVEETQIFEELVSRDYDDILLVKDSWLKRIKRIFEGEFEESETENGFFNDYFLEPIIYRIESEICINFSASFVNGVSYQEFIKTYCENALEYVNGVSLGIKTKMYIDVANVDFVLDDETLEFIEKAKSKNHLYGVSDIIANRINYKSNPKCDYSAPVVSLYDTASDFDYSFDVSDIRRESDSYTEYILNNQTRINSTRYIGESPKKYDYYSNINKVFDSLKKDKVVVAYLTGKCGTTSVVIYGASYSSVDPNVIKLKVFDPLMYNLRVSEKDVSDKNVKLGYSELAIYKDEFVLYEPDDSGDFERYPYAAFNFEYGNLLRYHFGNTKRVDGLLSYSKSQIFFREQEDLSKQNNDFINAG